MQIIVFNGPPGCGKDTAAKYVSEPYDFTPEKLARPLYSALAELLDVTEDWLSANKDAHSHSGPRSFFGDNFSPTVRQMLIDLSEEFTKPRLGKGFFGEALARRIEEYGHDRVVVSDGGFQSEIDVLRRTFGENCISIVRLYRRTSSFLGDSRQWVTSRYSYDVYNNSSIEALQQQLDYTLQTIERKAA